MGQQLRAARQRDTGALPAWPPALRSPAPPATRTTLRPVTGRGRADQVARPDGGGAVSPASVRWRSPRGAAAAPAPAPAAGTGRPPSAGRTRAPAPAGPSGRWGRPRG